MLTKGIEIEKIKVREYCRHLKSKTQAKLEYGSRIVNHRICSTKLRDLHDVETAKFLQQNLDRPGLYKRYLSEIAGYGLFTSSSLKKGEYVAGMLYN